VEFPITPPAAITVASTRSEKTDTFSARLPSSRKRSL
jgi:hypothetical protein